MGLNIRHMTGIEGEVELVGYRAVVGHFLRWTLERRGEDGSGQPIWNLRASFSFQKDSMLLNHAVKKKITVRSQMGVWELEVLPDVVPKIENGTQYVIEGVICHRVEQPK